MRYRKKFSKNTSRRRKGMATLEFVMSLPFLFVLMAMIFTLGQRCLQQSEVTMEVRNRAWLVRSGVEKSTVASKPFNFGATMAGSTQARKTKDWRKYRWLGGERTSVSKTVVIAGTWDQKQVPEMDGSNPHAAALGKVGVGGAGAVSSMARLLRF